MRIACPYCGSGDVTYDHHRNVTRMEGFNALLRAKRCRDCGSPFATVETPITGTVAEAIEHVIGGWGEVAHRKEARNDGRK